MTGPEPTTRLLDGRTGWDARPGDGLSGVALDAGVLRLARAAPVGGDRAVASPALGRGRDGTWWLGGRWGLRRMGPCDNDFHLWRESRRVVALAVRGRRIAVALGSGLVEAFDTESGHQLAEVEVPDAVLVELAADGSIGVVDRLGRRTDLDPSGLICRADPGCRPGDPLPAQPQPPWPIGVTAGPNGFRLSGGGTFDWRGHRFDEDADLLAEQNSYHRQGQFLSSALDSGIPGCRWHRIRVDADLPTGTRLEAAFATTDGPAEGRIPQPAEPGAWSEFPAGDPHLVDWFPVGAGADSILSLPPGRYGYLRLRLTGDGRNTPAVYQVRLDLPRATSLDHLPAAYSEDPVARDFAERFLSLFDAQLEQIDEALARRGALLDADALPDDALGWLAGLLGTGFEAEMDVPSRRALLGEAPGLFRRRGTSAGLIQLLRVGFGVEASVDELGTARPWGAVGQAHLGSVRLFGSSTVRVRLGTSRLGRSLLTSEGNPDEDAILAGAHRIRVHVPAGTDAALVTRVVRSQIPAHVLADVRVASAGFVATTLRLGVDTVLRSPDPAIVGGITLGRRGVVANGHRAGTDWWAGKPFAAVERDVELVACGAEN
jgi:phage tail-like protein